MKTKNTDSDLLDIVGKRAYFLRVKTRLPWRIISQKMGYSGASGSYAWAMRYQQKHNLPKLPSRLTVGELAYQLNKEGMDWIDIAEDLNYRPDDWDNVRVSQIKNLAMKHKRKHEG